MAAIPMTVSLVLLGDYFFLYSVVIAAICVGIILCGFVTWWVLYAIPRNDRGKSGNHKEEEAFTDIRSVYPNLNNTATLEVEQVDEVECR
jgi:hypothetical protein